VGHKPGPSDEQPPTRNAADGALPEELRDALVAAGEAAERLAARGRHLHFATDPKSSDVIVEVHDLDGNVLGTIPPSKVLDIAAGGDLEI